MRKIPNLLTVRVFRLKEIMEYSSSPVLEAVGEYVSLIERDIDYDSAEELDDGDGLAG